MNPKFNVLPLLTVLLTVTLLLAACVVQPATEEATTLTEGSASKTQSNNETVNVYPITGVNKSRGYYTRLENTDIFADAVTFGSQTK
ncbi:MAG: hypothetical protein MI924_18915 [Chloroflexales bacterium]|nr:hypothetical protein [Chloroflexales bacterium]